MELIFTYSRYLVLLFIIPLIILIHFISIKFKKKYALKFANFDSIARIKGVDLYSKNVLILGISCIIIFLLVFALSGAKLNTVGEVTSFSFVIAIDTSRSMEATDFLPNRMSVAKQTAIDFVDAAPQGTRIGVVSFAGNSIIEQRMTDDKELVKSAINDVNVTFIGGTDLYNAISSASNLESNEKNKAIILLSDGQTNIGTIYDAIDYANKNFVTIHTIAMGTEEGSYTSYGLSKLDEQSLEAIAFNTNGNYFKAENKTALENSILEVLKLKKGNVSYDLSTYFLIAAIVIFVINYVLVNTRFGIFP